MRINYNEYAIAHYLFHTYTKYKFAPNKVIAIVNKYYDLFNMRMTKLYKLTKMTYFYDDEYKIVAGQNFIATFVFTIILDKDILKIPLRKLLNYRIVHLIDIDFDIMNYDAIKSHDLRKYNINNLEICSISLFNDDLFITHFMKKEIGEKFYRALKKRIIYDDLKNREHMIGSLNKFLLANIFNRKRIDRRKMDLSGYYIISNALTLVVPNLENSIYTKHSINKHKQCPLCNRNEAIEYLICDNCQN